MPFARNPPRTAAVPAVRSQRRLFFGAAGLLVAGEALFWVVLAAVQSNTGIAALDGPVQDGLQPVRNPWLSGALSVITGVASPFWMCVIGVVLALGWAARTREVWRPVLLAAAMAAALGLSAFITHQVDRAAPPDGQFLPGPGAALSFPSVPTFCTGVFLLVSAYLLVARRARRTTAVLAFAGAAAGTVAAALGDLYLGYHWLTDVIAALGLAVAVVGVIIMADGLREAGRARPAAPELAEGRT